MSGEIDRLSSAIRLALPLLREMRDAYLECGSEHRFTDDGGMERVEATLDPVHAAAAAEFDQAIAACEAALEKASAGRPS